MCAICDCGIDAGEADSMFSKDYECLDCGQVYKALGVIRMCPLCGSKRSKCKDRVRGWQCAIIVFYLTKYTYGALYKSGNPLKGKA